MSASDHNDLLHILNAHGQEFLKSFSRPTASSSSKRKCSDASPRPAKVPKHQPAAGAEDDSEEEWTGILVKHSESDENTGSGQYFEQGDHESTSANPRNVVVFSEMGPKSRDSDLSSMAQKKTFMSSKVSKLRDDSGVQNSSTVDNKEEEEERTNAQNDALLHRLIHTKLLSGSLSADLNLTSAQRKKALAGRVLELAGQAKLGKGEIRVREGERNKASRQVREGLLKKQKERQRQQLEEAKNLGNYHPTIKNLFESTGTSSGPKKHRDRGLKMGVGKFSRGSLKLSKEEINRVRDGPQRGSGRGG
ncbi:hypothetical protein GGX14DRAFT_487396, partial [Mycena pura]